nr:MAG TPA: tail-collar fiber protein [Caudoviricetes sp.]
MKFNGITKKGREYLAKIQAENKPINFAKIKIGDGRLDNYDNPAELEHLINQKVEKGILTLNQEQDTVILTTNIDNVSLRTGYYPREIGVFVNDNGQEIMYYYMNDGDETSWIPPETDGPFKIELKLNLIASNAQSIVVEGVGKDLYITKEFLETNYTQKGGYTGTAQEIDDRVVSALGKEDGKFPLTEAVKGNVYYFPGNKKFYICKEAQNRRVSVPDGNFEELSIWENRKRLENLCKSEKLYDGKAESVGKILINSLPSWVKTLKIQGSNDDGYYFQDVYISVETLKEKIVFVSIGSLNDIRIYGLSLKNGVLKIENAANSNTTADNNYIRKIYGLSY